MKPIYKRVKVLKEHCPKCGEQLMGNNSYNTPWTCSCGQWSATGEYPWDGEYEVLAIPKGSEKL